MTPRHVSSVTALASAVAAGALLAGCGGGSSGTAGAAGAGSAAPRPSITVRVDDRRISAPLRTPAGYVDFHIVTSGRVHHHLAFWHLRRGVTPARFIGVLKRPDGDPFKLGTAIGGNGPMLSGHFETTMRLTAGTVVFADIVDGPTTRIASFRVTGPPVSEQAPRAAGTIVNRGFRFTLPTGFGRPGVYRFTNPDPIAHDGAIFPLAKGETAADLVHWMQGGGKGRPPALFDKPYGGPGAIGARSTSSFRLPKLPPGRYVLACFLPTANGVLHAQLGMVAGFDVR